MPATAQPKRTASAGDAPRASAAAKPPLKASPAPEVSTTAPAWKAGTRVDSVARVEQRPGRAERDQRGARALAQEDIAGLAGVVDAVDRDAGHHRRLGLVGRHVIAEREDRIVDRHCGRRVEHRDHARGPRDLEPAPGRRHRLLELGDEHRGGADRVRGRLDVGRADRFGGAGDDDDGVVAGLVVDEDEGGAGRLVADLGDPRDDPLPRPGVAGDAGEIVGAELRDEGDLGAGPRRGDRLVRALAARAELEARSRGWSRPSPASARRGRRDRRRRCRGWRRRAPVPSRPKPQAASGGMTPFLKTKQP